MACFLHDLQDKTEILAFLETPKPSIPVFNKILNVIQGILLNYAVLESLGTQADSPIYGGVAEVWVVRWNGTP